MARPKKQTMEPAIIALAEEAVAENPRGAPETIHAEAEAPLTEATLAAFIEANPLPPGIIEPEPPIVATLPLPPRAGRPSALDDAPVGSKIVVSKDTDSVKRVNLTMPNGVLLLPSDDIAYTLPVGAKIRRVMPSVFQATELDPVAFYPVLVAGSARDAVERYREHFHKD